MRKLVFAVLPTLLMLGALELGLGLAGIGESEAVHSRGFDDKARYLVPAPGRPGYFVTQIFGGDMTPEKRIPPKGNKTRVLLFGGSNTQAFPFHDLAKKLNEQDTTSNREYEVINLGRSGYGSGRVSILFEQAMVLEPDAVIIYSGHNEFVEEGFRMDLDQGVPGPAAAAAELASSLRVFNALVALMTPAAEEEHDLEDIAPKDWEWEYNKFRHYTYDQTLEKFEQYERNLALMCETALDHGVTTILCTVTSNDLANPFSSNLDPDLPEETREAFQQKLLEARTASPELLHALAPIDASKRMHVHDWKRPRGEGEPPEGWELPPLRAHKPPLDARPGWFTGPRVWRPRVFPFLEHYSRWATRDLTQAERANLETVREATEAALELVPEHPESLFRLGLVAYALDGDAARAGELFRDAARLDRAPRKASDLSNDKVRAVAEAHPGVVYLDVETLYRDRCPDGITGFELMKDECHFHNGMLPFLMQDFADVLLRELR